MQVGFCTCIGARLKMMRERASIGAMMALPSTGLILTFCFIFVSLRIESYLLAIKNIPLLYSVIKKNDLLFFIIVRSYFYYCSFLRSSVLDPDPGPYVFWSPDPDPSMPSPSKKSKKNLISTIL